MLRQYDTLIIDEAHERSLNIDFILGYLKQLLPRRPDLKVIITSATIDPERFARHFGDAPIVEVSGRTYPVEVRYRPIERRRRRGPRRGTRSRRSATRSTSCAPRAAGDILVFLSGEREIRDTADALAKQNLPRHRDPPAVRPAVRRRAAPGVPAAHGAPGRARHQRRRDLADRARHQVRRRPGHRPHLPLQPPAQGAAAADRADLAGLGQPAQGPLRAHLRRHLHPALRRGGLPRPAGVHRPGDPAHQPRLGHPADDRARPRRHRRVPVRRPAGPAQRQRRRATCCRSSARCDERTSGSPPLGRKLAQLPVDPRLARMVLEADRNGCVARGHGHRRRAVDPGPARAARGQAAGRPTRSTPGSPTRTRTSSSYLNLWNYLREQQKELSVNQFRRLCKAEFLNYLRVREWQDLYSQLRQVATDASDVAVRTSDAGRRRSNIHMSAARRAAVPHRAEGRREETRRTRRPSRASTGARGARFAIFPGSALFKKPPRWVMAAELVETSRLWARIVARIEPEWAEPLAEHLVKRTYSEPHWEKKQGAVMAYEKVTLYGVPIVAARKVNYGRIDPELSPGAVHPARAGRGRLGDPPRVLRTTTGAARRGRGARAPGPPPRHPGRRRDAVRLLRRSGSPSDVVSGRHFDTWWKKARRDRARPADFDPAMLVNDAAGRRQRGRLPRRLAAGRAAAAADLPVRAGHRRRRRHRAHPAAGAQPGRRRRVRLADPRPARGARHRADPVAAQGAAAQLRARRPTSPRRSSARIAARRGAAARRAGARAARADRRGRARATPGTSTRCRTTCG